jgi:Leucyl aminopeptidase (aminopeptidase T)
MDTRVHEHAETLVDWSARIDPGDDVVVHVGEGSHDLAVAVAGALGERGANLLARHRSDEVQRAYLRGHEGTFESDPAFERDLYEQADSVLSLRGTRNTRATADVSDESRQSYASA